MRCVGVVRWRDTGVRYRGGDRRRAGRRVGRRAGGVSPPRHRPAELSAGLRPPLAVYFANRSAQRRLDLAELERIPQLQRPPRQHALTRRHDLRPSPSMIRSMNAGVGMKLGRPRTRPSALVNSLLVTGCGAVALSGPRHLGVVEAEQDQADLVLDGESSSCIVCRSRPGRRRTA